MYLQKNKYFLLIYSILKLVVYNNKEIAIKTKKNSFYISQILNTALSKLKNDEMRNEIFSFHLPIRAVYGIVILPDCSAVDNDRLNQSPTAFVG